MKKVFKTKSANIGQLLTPGQVANRFAVSTDTVGNWAKKGLLPAIKITERCTRYREEDVNALESGTTLQENS